MPVDWQLKRWELAYTEQANAISEMYAGKNPRVLDVGCGAGYGTKILRTVSNDVVGIDNDPEVMPHEEGFVSVDVTNENLPNDVDVIVANQFIEHLHNPRGFIRRCFKALRPGGALFMSTPNRDVRLDEGEKPRTKGHVTEYDKNSLIDLFSEGVPEISGIYGNESVMRFEALRRPRLILKVDDPTGCCSVGSYIDDLIKHLRDAMEGYVASVVPDESEGELSYSPLNVGGEYPLDLLVMAVKGAA